MDLADFGRYLAQQRELRGLTREEVSRQTKISVGMLTALEEGQAQRLPERVFLLKHIRAYAEAIGLSPDDTVLRYEELDKTVKTLPPPPALERERRKRAWVMLAAFLLAVGVVGYLAFGVLGAIPASGR